METNGDESPLVTVSLICLQQAKVCKFYQSIFYMDGRSLKRLTKGLPILINLKATWGITVHHDLQQ
jgi:hypothetical protein